MIPFASQRALGQDLATHLLNAQDNEYVELADMRGAVAGDLHGAFAEWEAQAHALTKCRNYLYSMSVNPDPEQGPLTREQYFDYIARAEERLGLSGQPRAVVFHIKHGREHCHVVWSRIDTEKEKAVHMAFDKDKLMMVTREFAWEHKLELPDGYFREKGEAKSPQVSVYEMAQKRATGLTREDHIETVTNAWRRSDSDKGFVQALAEQGYMLATGKRPYVLVDFYGGTHALPRLIGDKTVRAKDIRAFLEKDFPPDSLPKVDEAKALIAAHRASIEAHEKSGQRAEAFKTLERAQAKRRQEREQEAGELRQRQHRERLFLAGEQRGQRNRHRAAFLARTRQIRLERYDKRPTGLAAFLGRVTGIALIRKKVHEHQDKKRLLAFLAAKEALAERHQQARTGLEHRQDMQGLDMRRKLHALEQVEKRERKALEESLQHDARIRGRGGRTQMPALSLDLKPRGRKAVPYKAKTRHTYRLYAEDDGEARRDEEGRRDRPLAEEFPGGEQERQRPGEFSLGDAFARAAQPEQTSEERGSSDGPKPAEETRIRRYGPKRDRGNDNDRGR
jgi:hypothetical protein